MPHKDLYLGFFRFNQKQVNAIMSGDTLIVSDEGCKNNSGELVLKFSRKFSERITEIRESGFVLVDAKNICLRRSPPCGFEINKRKSSGLQVF